MDLNPSKTNWTPRNFCDLTRLNNFVRKAKIDVRYGVEITYKDFLHGDVRKKGKKLMNYKLIELPVHGDKRGKLVAIENLKQIPFEIKRVYYMFDTLPNESRGFHAHKDLEQLIIAMDGACRFVLDDGKKRETVLLNRPDVGLYIGPGMWREMHDFSYGCKLVVLASKFYDENEYIRDYDEFIKANGNKNEILYSRKK